MDSSQRFSAAQGSTAQLAFTIAPDTDCWSLHVVLTQAQLQAISAAGTTLSLRVARTDDPSIKVTSAEFLTRQGLPLSTDPISQGYAACRYPNLASEEQYVTGGWTAKVIASSGFGGIDVTQVPVWLVQRHIQAPAPLPTGTTEDFLLPVRFVLVGPPDRQGINVGLLEDAVTYARSLFNAIGIRLREPPGTRPAYATTTQYTQDLYSQPWTQLREMYATSARVTVFVMANLAPISSAEGAVGFSMIPGPQGFVGAQSVVVSRVKADSSEDAPKLAKRLVHELSHYLGSVHESACLDASVTSSDVDVCRAALRGVDAPNATAIRGNAMFTVLPGGRYNSSQAWQLRRSPIVTRTVTLPAPKTPVTRLWVRVHTGVGFRSAGDFFRGDGPGTDDDVHFALKRSGAPPVSRDVGSLWNDFEAGTRQWYQLDPGTGLFEEDITGFTISKVFAYRTIFGDDHWHLQGLEIQVNGREWFSDDDLNTWLVNDDSGPSSLTRPLHRPTTQLLTTAGSPPPGSSATPPFAAYPVALEFGAGATTGVTPAAWSALGVPGPTFGWQAWVRPEDLVTEQTILTVGDSLNGLQLRIRAGAYEAVVFSEDVAAVASSPIPPRDEKTWAHLYAGCDGTTLTLARNGATIASVPSGGVTPSTTGTMQIGIGGFAGEIRETCLWTGARSVEQLEIGMFSIDQDDPAVAGYWPMDEADGDTCFDNSRFDHDAAVTNASWMIPASQVPNAMFLPGTAAAGTSFVTIPAPPKLAADFDTGITMAAWVKTSGWAAGESGERTIIGNGNCALRIIDGKYEFGMLDTTGDTVSVAVAGGDDGTWVHVAGTYDRAANEWSIVRDGHVLAIAPGTAGFQPAAGDWSIGGRPTVTAAAVGVALRGVALVRGAVPLIDVQKALMPIDASPPNPDRLDDLVAYWPLNDGAGSQVHDGTVSDPTDPTAATGTFDPAHLGWTVAPAIPALAFADPGGSIASVVASITDASQQNPYTVHVGPGTFAERIQLPPWISLTGSGQDLTTITAPAVAELNPTIEAYGNQMIAQLTAVSTQSSDWGAFVTALLTPDIATDLHLHSATLRGEVGDNPNANVMTLNVGGTALSPGLASSTVMMWGSTVTTVGGTIGNSVVANSAQVSAFGCTFSGGVWATVLASGPGGLFTLDHCTVQAVAGSLCALQGSSGSAITARGCQITGTTEGSVTVTP